MDCHFCQKQIIKLNNQWCLKCPFHVGHIYIDEKLAAVYFHVPMPNGNTYCVYQDLRGYGWQITHDWGNGSSNIYSASGPCPINPTNAREKIQTILTFL